MLAMMLVIAAFLLGGVRRSVPRADCGPLVLRTAADIVSTLLYLMALRKMALADLSAIMQALPLAVTLAAALVFREKQGWRRFSAIGIGYAGVVLILDEIQSGYGRSGRFFAHQWAGIKPDIVTMAKGMANGFPIGGVLISPEFEATKGMLGTTFGGNYLAMAAANAVADIFKEENLVANAFEVGEYLKNSIPASPRIREVRGRGLMVGIEFNEPIAEIRGRLLYEKHIFTGVSGKNMIRLLAPLTLTKADVDIFIDALKEVL